MAYNLNQRPGESIEKYYLRLAKVADQRLVRLEEASKEERYKGAKTFAYARAARDIVHWGGNAEKPRFNTKPPKNKAQLQAKINDIKTFLEAKSSTKSGIKAHYIANANKINELYLTNIDWVDVANFYGKEKNADLDRQFGSKDVVIAIANLQKIIEDNDLKPKSAEQLQQMLQKIKTEKKFELHDKKGFNDKIARQNVNTVINDLDLLSDMYDMLT